MSKTVTVHELVQLRKTKQSELEVLSKRVKIVRKEIREINKKIQSNLDNFVTSGLVDTAISIDNFGYDFKIKEQIEEEQKDYLSELVNHASQS